MKRRPVKFSSSAKKFSKRAGKTHRKNISGRAFSRGGQVL